MKQSLKIMISGGGTGGHVFPAIAIANAIKLIRPNTEFLFVGAKGKMEMEKVPQAGYNIEGLWISGFQRRLTLKNLLFPIKLIISMIKAIGLVKKFKPDAVIGVGGYASGPVLRVAALKGIPTIIHEANSYPGIANKLLANKVDKICVAFSGMEKFFPKEKLILTGNPVRKEVVNLDGKREKAYNFFNLKPNKKTILVVGGSLGARTINQSITKNLSLFKKHDIQLIWQTGNLFADEAKLAITDLGYKGAVTLPFITKMDYAYAAADLIISRAGAMAISELCLVGKPAIFVPSPNVAEDHQTKNALTLVSSKAAIMVKDSEAKEILVKTAIDLIKDPIAAEKLSSTIQSLGLRDVSKTIANLVINLIEDKKVE